VVGVINLIPLGINNMLKDKDKEKMKAFFDFLDTSSLGINLVVSTFIGLGIGLFIDKISGKAPLFTLIFLFLGIFAGFYTIYKVIKRKR
jgi:ATP synthase protein I